MSNCVGKLHNDTLKEVKLETKIIENTAKQGLLCSVKNPELSLHKLKLKQEEVAVTMIVW